MLPRTMPRTTRGLCRGLPADYAADYPRTMPRTTRGLCRRLPADSRTHATQTPTLLQLFWPLPGPHIEAPMLSNHPGITAYGIGALAPRRHGITAPRHHGIITIIITILNRDDASQTGSTQFAMQVGLPVAIARWLQPGSVMPLVGREGWMSVRMPTSGSVNPARNLTTVCLKMTCLSPPPPKQC